MVQPYLLIIIIMLPFLRKIPLSHLNLRSVSTLSPYFAVLHHSLVFCLFQTFPLCSKFTCCHTSMRKGSTVLFCNFLKPTLFNTAECTIGSEKFVSVHFFRSLPSSCLSRYPVVNAWGSLIFYSICANQMVQKMTQDSVMM